MTNTRTELLDPLELDTTAGTQARLSIRQTMVDDYATAMKNGDRFPDVVVFAEKGSKRYVLADGFHTRLAHLDAFKGKGISCEVREGTIFDAKLYAAGANHEHGVRRRDKDIQNAVRMLLLDPHTEGWADTVISDYAKCHRKTVAKVREKLILNGDLAPKGKRKHKQEGKTVEKPVPVKKGTSKKAEKKKKAEPINGKVPKKTQDDCDREDIVGAIDVLRSVVCSGSEALTRYKLNDYLDQAEAAADFLDDMLSSAQGKAELTDSEKAFLEVG